MENKSIKEVLESLFALVLIVPTILLRGLIITHCWGWFVIKAIPSLDPINIGLGLGLSFAYDAIKGVESPKKRTEEYENMSPLNRIVMLVGSYLAIWGAAFIVHLIIG